MNPEDRHGDTVVVGAPRSGTSLVAQLLARAGFRVGDDLLAPTDDNPLGFVEQISVSELNDDLLEPHVVGDGAGQVPSRRLAWLATPSDNLAVRASDDVECSMRKALPPSPAVVKDPRFTFTLDAWRPAFGPDTSFVAVVRDPAEVVVSLRTMALRDPTYYGGFDVTPALALTLWVATARRLLMLRSTGRWFVVDHASLLDGSAITPLGRFVGRPLDPSQVEPGLHRSRPDGAVGDEALDLASELRTIAATDLERWDRV